MTVAEKIEMTRKNLMSVPGYSFSETRVSEICENNDFIPDGAKVMVNGSESVYFENDAFVTKNPDGATVKSFSKSQMSETQLIQLFAIWASKNI